MVVSHLQHDTPEKGRFQCGQIISTALQGRGKSPAWADSTGNSVGVANAQRGRSGGRGRGRVGEGLCRNKEATTSNGKHQMGSVMSGQSASGQSARACSFVTKQRTSRDSPRSTAHVDSNQTGTGDGSPLLDFSFACEGINDDDAKLLRTALQGTEEQVRQVQVCPHQRLGRWRRK